MGLRQSRPMNIRIDMAVKGVDLPSAEQAPKFIRYDGAAGETQDQIEMFKALRRNIRDGFSAP